MPAGEQIAYVAGSAYIRNRALITRKPGPAFGQFEVRLDCRVKRFVLVQVLARTSGFHWTLRQTGMSRVWLALKNMPVVTLPTTCGLFGDLW